MPPLSEEDLELLKENITNIRAPGNYDKVFKDEDIFSFDRQAAWGEGVTCITTMVVHATGYDEGGGLGTCLAPVAMLFLSYPYRMLLLNINLNPFIFRLQPLF